MNNPNSCQTAPIKPLNNKFALSDIRSAKAVHFIIKNIHCSICAIALHNYLVSITGIYIADVSFEKGLAAIAYDPAKIDIKDIVAAIARFGESLRRYYRAEFVMSGLAKDVLFVR